MLVLVEFTPFFSFSFFPTPLYPYTLLSSTKNIYLYKYIYYIFSFYVTFSFLKTAKKGVFLGQTSICLFLRFNETSICLFLFGSFSISYKTQTTICLFSQKVKTTICLFCLFLLVFRQSISGILETAACLFLSRTFAYICVVESSRCPSSLLTV